MTNAACQGSNEPETRHSHCGVNTCVGRNLINDEIVFNNYKNDCFSCENNYSFIGISSKH